MSARDTIRRNKTKIIETLSRSRNHKLILNKAHERKLITDRECNNLTSIGGDVEEQVVRLVDKIMMKGENTCRDFLHLLESDEAIETTTAALGTIKLKRSCPSPPSLSSDVPPPESKREKKDDFYELTSSPTGLCVIINNKEFLESSMRRGTDKDAESLAKVFAWLGFRVLMFRDQTLDQMERTLKCFASLNDLAQLYLKLELDVKEWVDSTFTDLDKDLYHGDAFVCCILSHGVQGAVLGTDDKPLSIRSITTMFKTTEESALKGKPKIFLIQACQGKRLQQGVIVDELESDSGDSHSIPEQADILIAVATVEDYKAMRHVIHGSWFIQSLCNQLKDCCPRAEDFTRILHRVNKDISLKEADAQRPGAGKQMSEFTSRLTKTLVLSPHVK